MIQRIQKLIAADKTKVLLDQAFYSGTTFVTTLILARTLGLADFGLYASIQLYTFLLISISGAFVVQPMQVLYGKYQENKAYLVSTIYLQIGVLLFIAAFIFVLHLLYKFYAFQWVPILFPAGGLAMTAILFDYVRKKLLVENKLCSLLIIEISVAGLQIIIATLSYILKLSLIQILGLMPLSFLPVIILVITMVFYTKIRKSDVQIFTKVHLQHARWLAPTAIVQWLTSNFFVAASVFFLGVEALGAFRLVQTLFGLINVLLQGIDSYVLPRAAIRFQHSVEDAHDYIKRLAFKAAFPLAIVLLLLFILANQIIFIAGGHAYSDYGFVVRWMVTLYIIILINYPIRMLIRLHDMNHLFLAGYVMSFVVSILTAQYLLSQFQLTGAIIGLIINQIILFAIWQYSLHKKEISLWKSFT